MNREQFEALQIGDDVLYNGIGRVVKSTNFGRVFFEPIDDEHSNALYRDVDLVPEPETGDLDPSAFPATPEPVDPLSARVVLEPKTVIRPGLPEAAKAALGISEPNVNPAQEFLTHAAVLIARRGTDYDEAGGERSMEKTVSCFNTITGHTLTESEGWLLMQLLKDVRQWTAKEFHRDSAEDCVAYAALKAESLVKGGK